MTTPAEAPSDAELIERTREGDMAAYDELYRRHYDDASRVARIVTDNSDEAQDVVAEAFTRVLTRLREGGGPDTELTPYLRTVVRRLAIDRHRSSQRDGKPSDPSVLEILPRTDDPMARATDRQLVRQAFETLPDRWQQVLWHTEIEGRSPASLAATLGSTPNAVAALAYRAREGLRQAYLAVNLSSEVRAECRPYAPKVAAYVRGTLSAQHTRAVTAHLGDCQYCRERRDELLLLVSDLRGTLWPALLLPAAASAAAAAAATGAATGGAAAAAGSGAGASAGAHAGAETAAHAGAETAALAGAGAAAGSAAAGSGAGAAGGAGTAAAGGAGSGLASILSPGRLARMGSKTLAGTAGVVAAGIIAAGAYLMLSGSPEDQESAAPPPSSDSVSNNGGQAPSGSGGAPPEEPDDPSEPSEEPDDETEEPQEPDDPDSEPGDDSVPVSNPDPNSADEPDESADEPGEETDDPTPPDDDSPAPPSFDVAPENTTARAGQSATLSVQVSGSPAPSLQWQYRDTATASIGAAGMTGFMSPASGGWQPVAGATSEQYTIQDLQPRHDGRQYRVVASNDEGEVTSPAATLTVHYEPEITAHPSSDGTTEGGSVTFRASAQGNPAPTGVTWQYRQPGGSWQDASSSHVRQQGTRSTLELADVSRSQHQYEYRAVFSNSVGSASSNSAKLTVQWAPSVARNPSDAQANTGEQATFTAEAEDGNPGPTKARWQRRENNGSWQDMDVTSTGRKTEMSVNVESLNQNNTQYRVVFENDVGSQASAPATLKVSSAGTVSMSTPGGGKEWCVQPVGDGKDEEIQLDTCDRSPPPTWTVSGDDTGSRSGAYPLRWADGRCLGVSPSPQGVTFPVELRNCTNDDDQFWTFDPDDEGRQTFRTMFASDPHAPPDEVCLDVQSGVIARYQPLIAFPCHGGHNQLFEFD